MEPSGPDGGAAPPGASGGGPAAGGGEPAAGLGGDVAEPPQPIAARSRGPRSGNGWKVVELEHGWVRWHAEAGKIDGHCKYHGGGCKLDRRAHRGCLGLTLAWLNRGALSSRHDRDEHVKDKLRLSLEQCFDERQAARDHLTMQTDPLCGELAECEASHRDGERSEPTSVFIVASEDDIIEATGFELTFA